jgi:hypothetical protein
MGMKPSMSCLQASVNRKKKHPWVVFTLKKMEIKKTKKTVFYIKRINRVILGY